MQRKLDPVADVWESRLEEEARCDHTGEPSDYSAVEVARALLDEQAAELVDREAWAGPRDDSGAPIYWRNFYRCRQCGHEWTDDYSCQVEDDCPKCGHRHMSPVRSVDIDEDGKEVPPLPLEAAQ
jgi:rubrerythrin